MAFKPLGYKEEERGKTIPNTKRRYAWAFEIGSQKHQLELFCSFISSKRVVVLDGEIVLQTRNYGYDFEWKYELDGVDLQIRQNISMFPLFVNHQDFIESLQDQAWGEKAKIVRDQCQMNIKSILERSEQGTHHSGHSIYQAVSNINMNDFEQDYPKQPHSQFYQSSQVIDHETIKIDIYPMDKQYRQQDIKNDYSLDESDEQNLIQQVKKLTQQGIMYT